LPGYGQDGMRAAEFFDRAEYPIEWAQLVHSQASALLAHDLDTTIDDDPDADADDDEDDREEAEAEGDEDEDPEDEGDDESRGVVFAISQLAAADLILDPIHFVEHWVDIQILRARALGRRAQGELLDDPRDLLLRAKAFISHLEPSMLHQRVAVALLSLDAMDPGSLTPPSFDGSQAHDSRHDVQTLMELRQLGASLFERAKFSEAAPFLEKALNLGERLLDGGRSLKSLRLIAHEIGLIAKSLAYCHHRQGKYARALTTLERGKARLLLSSIETEQIASSLATPSKRDTAWNLVLERRQLIARSDSSMAFVEDIDRFVELQSELNQQILLANPPSRSTSIEYLSNIHEGAAIVWPLITKYGSAVYLVRSKVSGELTDSDVVQLPDFTSDTLEGWLKSDDGPAWLDVYEGRNKSRLGRNKFRETLTRISNLSFSCIFDLVCKKLKSSGVVDIIFVPNSGLQLLPLHCASPSMPETSEGLETALLDQFSFRAVPSATILQLLQGRAGGATGKRGFVAGVSKYDDPQWPDLLNAAVEARAVSDLIGAEPVLDDDVTPSLLSREVRGKQYVHIACHGANWATDPEFSAGFYPKAVLILKRGGVSTREILSTWDLEGTQLVCLSACDTGLIDLSRPWDEAEGITNVMFRLGAQKIVASLWSVDDTSTALLMARFYGNLTSAGMRVEEALRQAQNWLRSATAAEIQRQFPHLYHEDATGRHPDQSPPFAHPYFWASFVTTG
jgi:CHAT domain-containing protein